MAFAEVIVTNDKVKLSNISLFIDNVSDARSVTCLLFGLEPFA